MWYSVRILATLSSVSGDSLFNKQATPAPPESKRAGNLGLRRYRIGASLPISLLSVEQVALQRHGALLLSSAKAGLITYRLPVSLSRSVVVQLLQPSAYQPRVKQGEIEARGECGGFIGQARFMLSNRRTQSTCLAQTVYVMITDQRHAPV